MQLRQSEMNAPRKWLTHGMELQLPCAGAEPEWGIRFWTRSPVLAKVELPGVTDRTFSYPVVDLATGHSAENKRSLLDLDEIFSGGGILLLPRAALKQAESIRLFITTSPVKGTTEIKSTQECV